MKLVTLQNVGLNTFTNPLTAPPGSATGALNVVLDRPGEIDTRRGFEYYGTQITGHGTCIKMTAFDGSLILWFSDGSMWYDSDGAGTWVQYTGTYLPPINGFINNCLANGNLYFCTSNGIYKLDTLTGTPQPAGAPRGLDGLLAFNSLSGGFFENNSQIAYRVVWGYIDANNNTILGTPSDFMYSINTSGGAGTITLTLPIPNQASTVEWFYQVYRTPNTGSASVTPGDNLQLALELNLTPTDITNGFVTPTDVTPDALLGANLYTNNDANGESQTNDQPPLAQDICTYLDFTLFLNCTTRQSAFITLDSVGSPDGIQSGDTVSILLNSVTYTFTAASSNNFPIGQFAVVTGGTPASNIDATARNLSLAINAHAGAVINAYNTSTQTSLPGQILLQAVGFTSGVFSVTSSRTTCWDPELPTSGTSYSSSSTALPNQVYVSLPSQPEAVPIGNVIPVGSQNYPGYRISALRTGALTYKADGVFLLTGTSFPLSVVPVDTTVFIYGSNTAVQLNNSVFSFSTQAVVQGAESGVQIRSHVIESDLLDIATLPLFPSLAFGVQYESERKYILFMPSSPASTYCDLAYVYNWITDSWVTWARNATAGLVTPKNSDSTPGDFLFLVRPDGWVVKERKLLNSTDYADESMAITITAVNTTSLTLSSALGILVGDVIEQGDLQTVVNAVDTVTNIVSVDETDGFMTGSATDFASYPQTITYQPINGGWPNAVKRWSTLQFSFANVGFDSILLSLSSDFSPYIEQVTLVPKHTGQWGTFPWGSLPFGFSSAAPQLISTYATNNTAVNTQLFVTLTLQQSFQNFGLGGVMGNFNIVGERFY